MDVLRLADQLTFPLSEEKFPPAEWKFRIWYICYGRRRKVLM